MHGHMACTQVGMARAVSSKTEAMNSVVETRDPFRAAKLAGLRYVSDVRRGIARRRAGKSFSYTAADGKVLRDKAVLARIRGLVIPPAWTDVWISPHPHGHLQATGRDARGRKQYRYHPRWREVRDEAKYDRLVPFAESLPRIRARTDEDLQLPGLPRAKVLATVVRLLEMTLIRIGNEEYARTNHSFGLTTLRDRHVDVDGAKLTFHFRGKSGKEHSIGVRDRRLARIVGRCQAIEGEELFQYVDDAGAKHAIESGDVNDYLRTIAEDDFTAKDFRTWAGTVLAAEALNELGFQSATEAKRNIAHAIKSVAARLGNTPSVCRKCYVHPAVLDAYEEGALARALAAASRKPSANALAPSEAAIRALLAQRLAAAAA